MQWDWLLPSKNKIWECFERQRSKRLEKTGRRNFGCEISDRNRTGQPGHHWNKSLLPLTGLWKVGKIAQLQVVHVRELKLNIVEFLPRVWVAGWDKMMKFCTHHNRGERVFSIYYEYFKSGITAILFMLDFTCKLMEDLKPEDTGERQTDTLGKGISKIMSSYIGFAEGSFCWHFSWLVGWPVGWVFSR